jgi:hypothetical protein
MLMGKGEEEAKSVPITGQGVRAGVALAQEPFGEEGLEQFGKGGLAFHRWISLRWQRRVASFSNSGVADRYQ